MEKMSSKNPEVVKKTRKRRKTQERQNEPKEGSTSSGPCERSLNREESFDPFQSQAVFDEKAKGMTARDWTRACKTLSDQVMESAADLDELQEEEPCEECGDRVLLVKILASTQLKKSQRALQEYGRRYLKALRDLNSEKEETIVKSLAIGEELEGRLKIQAEERREVERERDQLRASLASREEQLRAALAAGEEEMKMAERREVAERERDQLRASLASREEQQQAALAAGEENRRGGKLPLPGTQSQRRWR